MTRLDHLSLEVNRAIILFYESLKTKKIDQLRIIKRNLEFVTNDANGKEENPISAIIQEEKPQIASPREPNDQCVDLKTISNGVKAYVRDFVEQKNIPSGKSSWLICISGAK